MLYLPIELYLASTELFVHKVRDVSVFFVGMSRCLWRKQKIPHGQFLWVSECIWEPGIQILGLHMLFYSSWDQQQIDVWPQVFKDFPSFLAVACLISPKLFQAHQLLTVGKWVSNWLKPCLLMQSCCCCCFECLSMPLAPQSGFLLAIPVSGTCLPAKLPYL